jgi:hypothetical protein
MVHYVDTASVLESPGAGEEVDCQGKSGWCRYTSAHNREMALVEVASAGAWRGNGVINGVRGSRLRSDTHHGWRGKERAL